MTALRSALPEASAVVGSALMFALLAALLIRYFAEACAPDSRLAAALSRPDGAVGSARFSKGRAFGYALIAFLASRALIFAGTAAFAAATGRAESYFANPYGYWVKWDAPHYLGLIRNWYVNEGDAMYHIVFFPAYPLVCRLLLPAFGGNVDGAAFFVSNACAVAAAYTLYALVCEASGERAARRAVRYMLLNPLSFFLSLPYTESLFLLLTLLAVYLARRGRFGAAVCVGAVCSATRLMGAIVAIPIYFEMLAALRGRNRLNARTAVSGALACCGVLAGALGYLWLNYAVTGNPFQFWIYQRDHWYNTTGTLWNTFSYVVSYALSSDANMRMGTWIPTVLALYGSIALLAAQTRRARAGDAAYGWAYLFMTIVPTWLISGPRYVSGLYALYPMLARVGRRKWADGLITAAFALAGLWMACAFAFYSGVY